MRFSKRLKRSFGSGRVFMMLLYWYTNTFVFCLCLWLPWRLCPCLLVLYIHRCQGGLGLFQPSCPQALHCEGDGQENCGSGVPNLAGRSGVRGPSAGAGHCPAQGLGGLWHLTWWLKPGFLLLAFRRCRSGGESLLFGAGSCETPWS